VAVLSYMLLTIVYVTGTTVLISYGEFNRYRFDIDPFYLVLCVLLLRDIGSLARQHTGFGRCDRGGCGGGDNRQHI
jgi:hypothetical protein